jgi:hypothetical protein
MGAMGSGSSYMLEGRQSELARHVGQQVEITGRVRSGSSSSASGTSGSTSGTSGSMGAERVQVSTVKMISSSCSNR